MNPRNKGLDLYRIIACGFVIINHCNSKVLLQVTPKSLAWFVALGVIFITKICVPGFLMITGYNLLHRSEELQTYVNRIKRILIVLAVFSLFYYVWRCIIHTMPLPALEDAGAAGAAAAYLLGFVKVLWQGGATDAFWYLYMYLGLLIMMPVFQMVASEFFTGKRKVSTGTGVKCETGPGSGTAHAGISVECQGDKSKKRINIVTICAVVAAILYVSVIPSVCVLFPGAAPSPDFIIPMICTGTLYLFAGHLFYINRERIGAGCGIKAKDLWLVLVFIFGFALNMCLSMLEYADTEGASFISYSEINMSGMLIESVAAFALFLKIRADGSFGRVIAAIAPASFGIYLLADFMCSNTHMIYYYLCQYMNRLLAVFIQEVAAYALGLIAVLLLRRIPVVRKYI